MKLSSTNILLWGKCLLIMLACSLSTSLHAQADVLYNKANTMYKANNYAAAQTAYETLTAQGYKNAALYYNLGNSYYKQNQLAKAILNYERALRLSPNDEDIAHNLSIANARIADKITPVPQLGIITTWQHFSHSHTAKGWGLWAIAAAWLALVSGIIYLFAQLRAVGAAFGVLFVVLCLSFSGLAYSSSYSEGDSREAILITADTYVKSAPDANSSKVLMIHEGLKFVLLDKVGQYSKVRLADGKTGWLESSYYEKI